MPARPRRWGRGGWAAALAIFAALPGNGQQCSYYMTPVPSVLLNDGSNTMRLEIFAGASATSVRWEIPAGSPLVIRGSAGCSTQPLGFDLKDDGTQGDRVAGDHIFTIDNIRYRTAGEGGCNVGLLRGPNQPDGYLDLRIGVITITTPAGPVTLDATQNYIVFHVAPAENYRRLDDVSSVSAGRQESAFLVNLRDDTLALERGVGNLAPNNGLSTTSAVFPVSGFLPDNYDFRALVSTNETLCASRFTGVHVNARNTATGLGNVGGGSASQMQAGPKLQGVTYIAWQGIGNPGVWYHETNHQWGAYLASQLGLNDSSGHWLQNTSVGGSLGGCTWVDNGDGTFTSRGVYPSLENSDLELYLTGLIPAEQVKPLYIASTSGQQYCTPGTTIQGPFRRVAIEDIVAVHGRRAPGPEASQKDFKLAMVVTSAERNLTPLEMTYYGRLAQAWEGYTIETAADPPLAWPKFTRGLSTLSLKLDSYSGPFVRAAGVVHGASTRGGPVAPGQVVVIYGLGIGPSKLAGLEIDGATGRVSTQVAEMRVWFDEYAAPVIYTSAGQVSVVVPYGIAGRRAVSMQVEYAGQRSNTVAIPIAAASLAIFTQNLSGSGPGAILNEDNSINTAARKAAKGSVIQVYATGEGSTNPAGVDGRVNTSVLPVPLLAVTATIDGQAAEVLYRGAAPTALSGLFQVNLRVPEGARSGEVPIQLRVGSFSSPSGVTVFVE